MLLKLCVYFECMIRHNYNNIGPHLILKFLNFNKKNSKWERELI